MPVPRSRGNVELAELSKTSSRPQRASRFHARQIFRWIWQAWRHRVAAMTDLPRALRADLAARHHHRHATDRRIGRIRRRDPEVRPAARRRQAASSRCSSLTRRRRRSASRPRSAVRWGARSASPARWAWSATSLPARSPARSACSPRRSTCCDTSFNIVLMGMGEPLHNYDETMKALRHAER